MSSVIRFSADLGTWLVQQLDHGQTPAQLVHEMVEGQMDPYVARAIVDAFVLARREGTPLPVDSLLIEEPSEYVAEPSRLSNEARIATADRQVRVLARSHDPTWAVLGDLLSPEECRELIDLARPRLAPSTIVNPYSGQNVVAANRTSLGMFFRLAENALVERLDRRVAGLVRKPVEHGEGFQVLCYPAGAQTTPHFDFLQPSNDANRASIARSGQRVSTLIAYLNDVPGGGETVFPKLGLSVIPQRGNAVYFEYANSQGQVDARSLHAGNPVLSGEKWVLTKWTRQRRFVSAGEVSSDGMLD